MHNRDTIEMIALLNLAHELSRKDTDQAKSYAYQAVSLARQKQNNVKLGNGYGYLVTLHQNSGRLDSGAFYLGLLEALSKSDPNTRIKMSYAQVAGLFYKNQGLYSKALTFMLENLKMLTVENENKAGQLLNIGNAYQNLGDYKNAMEYHLKSLRLFDELKSKRGQSFCLQNLGNDFLSLKQYQQARNYFARALKLKEELQDKRGTITSVTGLGDAHKELGQYDIAENYYLQAIQLSREMKLPIEESRSRFQLGVLYERMKEVDKARASMTHSLQLARQSGDSTMAAKISSELNNLNLKEKKELKTENTFMANLNTFITSGDRNGEAMEYARLSEYYASKKQFERAYYFQRKYQSLKDSVEGSAVLLQMKQLEEQYNSEKKEREIELLKKDQALKEAELEGHRANQTLIGIAFVSVIIIAFLLINRYRIMNRTKRQLELEQVRLGIARDLHDDIGSTLSSINIMSQLALQENGNAGAHLKKIAAHSAGMMENMSDIVWSINPKNDSLEQVVSKMKEFAAEILEPREIAYTFHLDESIPGLKLDVEKRKNLFLIFKEAVNNAAKYSGATQVDIQLTRKNGMLHMSITDNGKGFDESTVGHGNGLNNMMARAQSMDGTLNKATSPGNGCLISVNLPFT